MLDTLLQFHGKEKYNQIKNLKVLIIGTSKTITTEVINVVLLDHLIIITNVVVSVAIIIVSFIVLFHF